MSVEHTKRRAEAVNALADAATMDEKARALRDLINVSTEAAFHAKTPLDAKRWKEQEHYFRGALHAITEVGVFA